MWIGPADDSEQWRFFFVNMVMNLWFQCKGWNFFDLLIDCYLPNRTMLPDVVQKPYPFRKRIVRLNPTGNMDVCLHVSLFMLSSVDGKLVLGRFPFQRDLKFVCNEM